MIAVDMPSAVVAVISAVVEEHRYAEPADLARLIARELRREGWRITAPLTEGRLRKPAVGPADRRSGSEAASQTR